ncbi:MAG: hemolysin D [Curvibacter sp. RIFCSPHIGHO2_12_FULL_63_18]|uniref:HlyD family type I secretion periplasmic adaptor subunit n=1 Tax=Rhodoferax sp. TaxID=50421 RepID=UPI0008ADC66E|nr:HlyD family type I secretion periplasmic adaptor subunit [Rhodoferax sp.]OGO98862.1 MAG: hemolysin D [Curvibacter sp. GWA2_63_95]OGP06224.1 MAG: hemolysin D [Curvibacter sp. RIFCSPHIGHO2_12_FULL_63_18]HCX83159.1 hemolysin D [Rhodoferax sp.]
MSAVLDNTPFGSAPVVDLNDARPRRWGWWLLVLGLGGFMAWATLAPLDAAVTSSGSVVVSGSRKLVQPVSGGKVAAILARDGDQVVAGQVLLRLDSTQSRALLDIARGQWLVAMATQARLSAENQGLAAVDFPPELLELGNDARVAEVMELQSRLLESRRQTRNNEMQSLEATLRGLEYQAQGHEAARQAKETQSRMLREELRNQRTLADEGFFPRNRVSEQERLFAGIQGGVAEDSSSVGRTRQAIVEVRARIATRQQEFRKDIESQLSDIQRETSGLESRMRGLEFDLANTEVRAPATGTVMGASVHTVGGVVSAGTPLMELVPKDDPLRVEAQLPVHMVDKVRPGLPVHVLFSALNQASTPHIEGRVVQVSADALADSRQNTNYFKVVVEVTPQGMTQLQHQEIRAGMPAEVFIKTGERTFMSYLLKPLLDRMNRALIEP